MFRNIAFALATAAALGTATLAPTSASAHPAFGGHFHGGHFGYGPHGFGPGLGFGIAAGVLGAGIVVDSCYRRAVIDTPYGPEVRLVNVCY
jgi:hypothetical protein